MSNVILEARVGSKAYGLDTPESDDDYLGISLAKIEDLVGLHPLREKKATKTSKDPDTVHHELGKYCRLAITSNPTCLELLWVPGDSYTVKTLWGNELRTIRDCFPSARLVRNAYFGYACQQFYKLSQRGLDRGFSSNVRKRTAKNARHLLRLLQQGYGLYQTGTIHVRVDKPEEIFSFGERVEAGDLDLAKQTLGTYETLFDETRSPLPDTPDESEINNFLLEVRLG